LQLERSGLKRGKDDVKILKSIINFPSYKNDEYTPGIIRKIRTKDNTFGVKQGCGGGGLQYCVISLVIINFH